MATDDLLVWLRAQLDEEEAAAERLLRQAQETRQELKDPRLLGKPMPGWGLWPDVERMAADVLAGVEAKRAVLDLRDAMAAGVEAADGTMLAGAAKVRLGAYDNTVRLIASVYAEKPGYREEWGTR